MRTEYPKIYLRSLDGNYRTPWLREVEMENMPIDFDGDEDWEDDFKAKGIIVVDISAN